MKYTLSNTINKPFSEVTDKYKDPRSPLQWMDGLNKIEPISGVQGEKGAVSDYHFSHKGKDMKITQTIEEQNYPNQVKYGYRSDMGYNTVEMLFEKIDENTTKQTCNSYFELKGFMKIMGVLLKGMFKKQTMTYMNGFKKYAEQ